MSHLPGIDPGTSEQRFFFPELLGHYWPVLPSYGTLHNYYQHVIIPLQQRGRVRIPKLLLLFFSSFSFFLCFFLPLPNSNLNGDSTKVLWWLYPSPSCYHVSQVFHINTYIHKRALEQTHTLGLSFYLSTCPSVCLSVCLCLPIFLSIFQNHSSADLFRFTQIKQHIT